MVGLLADAGDEADRWLRYQDWLSKLIVGLLLHIVRVRPPLFVYTGPIFVNALPSSYLVALIVLSSSLSFFANGILHGT